MNNQQFIYNLLLNIGCTFQGDINFSSIFDIYYNNMHIGHVDYFFDSLIVVLYIKHNNTSIPLNRSDESIECTISTIEALLDMDIPEYIINKTKIELI